MKRLREVWQTLTIKNKIAAFTCTVFMIVFISVAFDLWVVHFLAVNLNDIMEDNAACGELTDMLSREKECFASYIHSPTEENERELSDQIRTTYAALYKIPLDYRYLGEERFAQTQSIRNSYEIYSGKRDQILRESVSEKEHIKELYQVYEMQDYLLAYAQRLSSTTMTEGNEKYRMYLPAFIVVPVVAIVLCIFLLLIAIWITKLLNRSITSPILNLTKAARSIAANDFYIEDVWTDRKDEMGELVHVFNKMKYATGEYISALEEKREVLEQLHAQEMEKLEVEKQLEIMNLEVIRNQINPHFLFNTLNVIEGMANLENADTTEQMINALSSLFRYNLKNQDTEVLLSQELKVAQDYMFLQKMRFEERVEFEMQCLVKATEVIIPTFLLQPLLENAVVHGLSPKVEGGRICVKIWEEQGKLFIEVQDTGVGMDEETLTRLKENLKNRQYDRVGIGIGNIYRRIKIMFEDADLEMESKEGAGTRILLYIPFHSVSSVVGTDA